MDTKAWRASYHQIMPTTGRIQRQKESMERSMSKIELLPTEILIPILELVYLPRKNHYGHSDQRCLGAFDLLAAMKSCHRFNSVGQPVLWQRVEQTQLQNLANLVWTASQRPELAKHARIMELHGLQIRDDPFLGEPYDGIEQRSISNRVHNYQQWSSLASTALSLCENIEKLELNLSIKDHLNIDLLTDDFWSRNHSGLFLPRLRELSISFDKCCKQVWVMKNLIRFLKHPALQIFRGYKIGGSMWPLGENGKSECVELLLTSIHMESSNIDDVTMQELLESCTSLEEFTYDHVHNCNVDEDKFYPINLGHHLKLKAKTLKRLSLFRGERLNQKFHNTSANNLTTIGPLCDFPMLAELNITAHLLLGWQKLMGSEWSRHYQAHAPETYKLTSCLPRSLQKLRLMACGPVVLQEMIELVEGKERLVPCLESVVLEFQDMMDGKYAGSFMDRVVRRQTSHMMVNEQLLAELEMICMAKEVALDVWYN